MKKLLTICLVVLFATTTYAALTSVTAANAWTTFTASIGVLQMNGANGMISYDTINSPLAGTFELNVGGCVDSSSGGIAKASFGGGSFTFKDTLNNPLLNGAFASFNMIESFQGALTGNCAFTVTGGSLAGQFGSNGSLMGMSFFVPFNDISSFTSDFSGYSTMIAAPIPEPATIGLLSFGLLSVLKRRNAK
ncbi:MAG: PEP-CTERM sorting domain-containing protein [Phycisphaerales bacterium]